MIEEKSLEKKPEQKSAPKTKLAMGALLGKKVGMTQIFDDKGEVVPVSVVEVGPCIVVAKRTTEKDGYNALQVGFGEIKKVSKPVEGQYKKAGLEKRFKHLKEIKVEKLDGFELGQEIKVEDVFSEGQYVKVSGKSIGKGFAGSIKRWHFSRGPMSHGSKSHRLTGSIGAGTTPGRVYKGKKMAGQMGNVKVTVKNLQIIKVDSEKNMMLLRGTVPGKKSNLVLIRS